MKRVASFIEDVREHGTRKYPSTVIKAVDRFLADYNDKRFVFNKLELKKALTFIENLRHTKGKWAGKKLILQPWQVFVVANIFALYRNNGRRKHNNVFLSVARKNGKSVFASAIGLKYLLFEGEQAGEVYSVATKRDQAKIIFEESKRMVRYSPELKRRVEVRRDSLLHPLSQSVYRPLASEYDKLDGLTTSCGLIDELHAHKNRELFDVIQTSSGSRENPLILITTTAGRGDTRTVYTDLKDYSLSVLNGSVDDPSWFSMIFQVEDGDDEDNSDTWIKANPNLNISIPIEYLESQKEKLANSGNIQAFRRYHLNMDTEGYETFIERSLWTSNQPNIYEKKTPLELILERKGSSCWVGIDLSSVDDITCASFCFTNEDGTFTIIPLAWIPQETVKRFMLDPSIDLQRCIDEGYCFTSKGRTIDYDEIRSILRRIAEHGVRIEEIAVDPHNARYLIQKMEHEDGLNVFEHRQSILALSDPTKLFRKLILEGRLVHGNNPLFNWNIDNCETYTDVNGNIKVVKKADDKKIDIVVASIMALYRCFTNNEKPKPGIVVL